jgi:hypothetical protein
MLGHKYLLENPILAVAASPASSNRGDCGR